MTGDFKVRFLNLVSFGVPINLQKFKKAQLLKMKRKSREVYQIEKY